MITGGAGYIGSWVVRRQLAAGNRVVVYDNLMYGGKSLMGVLGHPNLQLIQGDVRDPAALAEAMRGVDNVVHLAAIVGEAACDKSPDDTQAINFGGTQNVAAAARQNDVQRMIFFSTCSSGRTSTILSVRFLLDAMPASFRAPLPRHKAMSIVSS